MQKLVFAQVPVECRVMNADVHGFLDSPGMTVNLLVHNIEMFRFQWMSCCGAVLVDGEVALRCSLTLSPRALP